MKTLSRLLRENTTLSVLRSFLSQNEGPLWDRSQPPLECFLPNAHICAEMRAHMQCQASFQIDLMMHKVRFQQYTRICTTYWIGQNVMILDQVP